MTLLALVAIIFFGFATYNLTCPHSSTVSRNPEQGFSRPYIQASQPQLTKMALRQFPRTARRKE